MGQEIVNRIQVGYKNRCWDHLNAVQYSTSVLYKTIFPYHEKMFDAVGR